MVIDSNFYWFPEELFTDEKMSERFLSEIPAKYDIYGKLLENPDTGLRQYVIEKPLGSPNLNYVQGDYRLEKQLTEMDKAGVERAVLKLSCQQEWMSLDTCKWFNSLTAEHVQKGNGRMSALAVVPPNGTKAVFPSLIDAWTNRA